MQQGRGFPRSAKDVISTGNLNWVGPTGDGTGIATDQTGSGTVYEYAWPCCGAGPTPYDFFRVQQPGGSFQGRTFGLLQPGDTPIPPGNGQWPFAGGSNFAVNPIDNTAVVMSSAAPPTGT